MSGQGAVVKLEGAPAGRVLVDSSDLAISLRDRVDNPDPLLEIPFPASSDVQIEPPAPQRPASRIDRLLALREAIDMAGKDSLAHGELAKVWGTGVPMRISVDAAPDLQGMLNDAVGRSSGISCSGCHGGRHGGRLAAAGVPVVLRMRGPQGDIPNGGVLRSHGFTSKDSPAWALAPPGDDLSQLGWAMSETAAAMVPGR